jgi:hypothetical protein
MPNDLRRITFNSAELLDALVSYDRHADQKLTCGSVAAFRVDEDGERAVTVDLVLAEEPREVQIGLSAEYVNTAVVMYCLNNNIPIFPEENSYLETSGGNVSLYVFR